MVSDPGLNSMTVYDDALLLVYTGGGDKVHLTAEAGPEDDAISLDDMDHEVDPDAVTLWATSTLCGRVWSRMAPTEPTGSLDEAVHAPTCRRCLSILDKRFPERAPDDGLAVVVDLAIESIVKNGTVEIYGCPGDQLDLLRRRIQAAAKQRKLGSLRSHSQGDIVVFWDNTPPEKAKSVASTKHSPASAADKRVPLTTSPIIGSTGATGPGNRTSVRHVTMQCGGEVHGQRFPKPPPRRPNGVHVLWRHTCFLLR